MRAPAHISFGLLIVTVFFGIWGKTIGWLLYLISVIVSLLADIDTPNSFISKPAPFITRFIERNFGGHRMITHSLLGWAIFGLLLSPLILFGKSLSWSILLTAYGSHLILDAFTISGVPLFWPHPIRAVIPRSPKWRFRVGSRAERILLAVILALLFTAVGIAKMGGVFSIMRWSFADIQSVIKQYRQFDKQGDRTYAQLEGKFNASQRQISKKLEIIGIINQNAIAVFDADTETVYSIGREEGANIYPFSIRCIRGEHIAVKIKEVKLRYEMLANLLKHVPPSGLTFIKGVVKTTDTLIVPRNPDTYETIKPGFNEIDLDYALPQQLLQSEVTYAFALSGHVFIRTIYPEDTPSTAFNKKMFQVQPIAMTIGSDETTPNTGFSSPHTVDLYITQMRDANDILVKGGDIIEKGTPIARRRTDFEKALSLSAEIIEQKVASLERRTADTSSLHIAEARRVEKQLDLKLKQDFFAATQKLYRIDTVSIAYLNRERRELAKAEHALREAQNRLDQQKVALEVTQKKASQELLQLTLEWEQLSTTLSFRNS